MAIFGGRHFLDETQRLKKNFWCGTHDTQKKLAIHTKSIPGPECSLNVTLKKWGPVEFCCNPNYFPTNDPNFLAKSDGCCCTQWYICFHTYAVCRCGCGCAHVHVCVCLRVKVYMCMNECVWLRVAVCWCTWMHVDACGCMWVHVNVYECVYVWEWVCEYAGVCLIAWVCARVGEHGHAYVLACVCANVCLCTCTQSLCVYVCTDKYTIQGVRFNGEITARCSICTSTDIKDTKSNSGAVRSEQRFQWTEIFAGNKPTEGAGAAVLQNNVVETRQSSDSQAADHVGVLWVVRLQYFHRKTLLHTSWKKENQ